MGDLSIPADRRAMSYKDFQETLDSCARTKAELGYNMPRNPDGTVDLDETVKLKFQETQKMGVLYNQFYGGVFGGGDEEGSDEDYADVFGDGDKKDSDEEHATVRTIVRRVID